MHDKIANICRVLNSCPVPTSFEPFVGTGLCTFAPVSEDLIRKLINDAPPKCCALDPIPTALLKTCYKDLVSVITKIITYSLQAGIISKTSFEEAQSWPEYVKELQCSVQSFVSVKVSGKSCALTVNWSRLEERPPWEESVCLPPESQYWNCTFHITNCLLESTDQGRVSVLSLLPSTQFTIAFF